MRKLLRKRSSLLSFLCAIINFYKVDNPEDLSCWLKSIFLRLNNKHWIDRTEKDIEYLIRNISVKTLFVDIFLNFKAKSPIFVIKDYIVILLTLISFPWLILRRVLNIFGFYIASSKITAKLERATTPLMAYKWLPHVVFGIGFIIYLLVITTPFELYEQLIFVLIVWLLSLLFFNVEGRFSNLLLSLIAMVSLGRYAWWRLQNTLNFENNLDAFLGFILLFAEIYTWVIVVFGLIQTAWPLKRSVKPIELDWSDYPSVDIFVPTYNEPISVVKPTLLGALSIQWPKEKLNIYLLDDGNRESFKVLAEELGVNYIARKNNKHAKAGNLNNALKLSTGEFVAIFDCDHIPVRSFLMSVMGVLINDPRCAMVQTPHHFFSPDPFEKNLSNFKKVPNESALFYGLIQDGNDFWNATFFCGSCAVIRRKPLMEVGGIAVETVTEDAHTALKLHRKGYSTAYINRNLAAGLATESLTAHIGQRIRWARGMAQIFRLDNPFLVKGLSFWQRVCYSNSMLHFFFGLPRLIFLTAPLCFLFFEINLVSTVSLTLLAYLIPYIMQCIIANAKINGPYRHMFWSEVYETVLAWYIWRPTTIALFKPSSGSFNVTAKGSLVDKSYFDWKISIPYIVILSLCLCAFLLGFYKLILVQDSNSISIIINLVWCFYTILVLGAAIGVASEVKQIRRMHRIATDVSAVLYTPDGCAYQGQCFDFSLNGLGVKLPVTINTLHIDQSIEIGLWSNNKEFVFSARVASLKGPEIGLEILDVSKTAQMNFVQCTFARPDAWQNWNSGFQNRTPFETLIDISKASFQGYSSFIKHVISALKFSKN